MRDKKDITRLIKLLFIIAFFIFSPFSLQKASAADEDYGVDPDVKKAVNIKAGAMVGYDVSTNEGAINAPKSVALLSCFNQSVKTNTSVTGSLFSGGFSKQAADKVLADDLKRYYEGDFEKDDFIEAEDFEMKWKMGASIEGKVSIGAGSGGPLVKGVKCDKMQKLWERKRNAGVNSFPTFSEAAKNLLLGESPTAATGEGGEKFRKTWGDDTDTKDELISAEERTKELKNKLTDPNFSGDEDPCTVIKNLGASIDCRTATQ